MPRVFRPRVPSSFASSTSLPQDALRDLASVVRFDERLGWAHKPNAGVNAKHACEVDHGGFDRDGLENDYSHWSVYERRYGPAFENAWRVTEALIERLSRRCAEDGAALVVFAFPQKLEVDDRWRRDLLAHFGIGSTLLDFHIAEADRLLIEPLLAARSSAGPDSNPIPVTDESTDH